MPYQENQKDFLGPGVCLYSPIPKVSSIIDTIFFWKGDKSLKEKESNQ